MPSKIKTIPVFVNSTFRDLAQERTLLVDRPGLPDPAQVARLNGGDWLHVLATTRLGEWKNSIVILRTEI